VFGQSKSKILKDTIDFLLEKVDQTGFKINGIYLGRQFFTVEVINYLQEKQLPFTLPRVLKGRSGGIRNLFFGRKS